MVNLITSFFLLLSVPANAQTAAINMLTFPDVTLSLTATHRDNGVFIFASALENAQSIEIRGNGKRLGICPATTLCEYQWDKVRMRAGSNTIIVNAVVGTNKFQVTTTITPP